MSKSSRGSAPSHRSATEDGGHKYKKSSTASDETIVIHVCDEFRKVNKDFVCNKVLLLDNMKYFKAYLNDASAHEDVDISVHCDVSIFEWLFQYIHADSSNTTTSTLAVDNVTSILISSDFLQMDFLVSECTSFISQHLEEVVGMPGDLLCISDAILDKIAAMCSVEQLDAIEATKDKLCHKLYSKRLQRIVSALKEQDDSSNSASCTAVECCVHCGVVYYAGHRPFLTCRRAKLSIGVHGNIVARHDAKPDWKVEAWVKSLTISFPTRQAYWKVWGALQCLHCSDCHMYFTGTELNECYHHDLTELTNDDSSYGCCGAKRFSASTRPSPGCKLKAHTYATSMAEYSTDNSSEYAMPELLERLHQLVASHADVIAREPPAVEPAPHQHVTTRVGGVHEMLASHVKPQISMLATCDVSNELMKAIKSNLPDVSTLQTRKQWKIDLLQEKDRIRVQMLSSKLTKMRVEYKAAKGS